MLLTIFQGQTCLLCCLVEASREGKPLRQVNTNLCDFLLFPGKLGSMGVAGEGIIWSSAFEDVSQ